jgi:hypothetical protein
MLKHKCWLYRWWARWFIPFPILVWYAKKNFWSVVFYQDRETQIEMTRRYDEH